MASSAFRPVDFKVFEVKGFEARMAQIRERIRPKLETLGQQLTPAIARATATDAYAHVAKHARRTVNPPDDTWVAFGPDARGYKKTPHFKVAVSKNCLRFLFEVGPEFGAKPAYVRAWKREGRRLRKALGRVTDLGWFADEHDEAPRARLAGLDDAAWNTIGDALTRTRDGQLVLGRRVEAREAARWRGPDYEKAALDTFAALSECFRLSRP